jgi:hypothetical protein
MRVWAAFLAAAIALAWASPSRADRPPEEPQYAVFALIVGVNTSVDPGTPSLRYADDDAARYLDLFRSLGARTYVLTRLDENTQRLHPQLAAEALLPLRGDFDRAVASLARDVQQARDRRVKTLLYFVYAGHGNVKDGRGYITLEDAQLDAEALDARVVDAVGADRTHFIVDACDSYFLALGRGPGGQRREAHGFAGWQGLRVRDSVGLLLSTSSARESHEWSGFQAGVFSHEVRSALYGAADADGDGQVSYREASAFIERANQAIPNEAYRPNVYARPPKDSPVLLDLRGRWHSRVDVPPTRTGHYLMEDGRGVRLADFHNDDSQPTYLLRPPHTGRLYLRRVDDDVEFVVPSEPDRVALAELEPAEPRDHARGAANDAYGLLFSLPFGPTVVRSYRPRAPLDDGGPREARAPWKTYGGVGLLGLGAGGVALGAVMLGSAASLRSDAAGDSGARSALDSRVRDGNTAAAIALAAGGVAAACGITLLLLPSSPARVDVGGSAGSAWVSIHGKFQ